MLPFCLINVCMYVCVCIHITYIYMFVCISTYIYKWYFSWAVQNCYFWPLNKYLSVYCWKTGTFSYITAVQLSGWDRIPEPPSAVAQTQKNNTSLIFPFSRRSQPVMSKTSFPSLADHNLWCLKTILSYFVSGFLVVEGGRVNPVLSLHHGGKWTSASEFEG